MPEVASIDQDSLFSRKGVFEDQDAAAIGFAINRFLIIQHRHYQILTSDGVTSSQIIKSRLKLLKSMSELALALSAGCAHLAERMDRE